MSKNKTIKVNPPMINEIKINNETDLKKAKKFLTFLNNVYSVKQKKFKASNYKDKKLLNELTEILINTEELKRKIKINEFNLLIKKDIENYKKNNHIKDYSKFLKGLIIPNNQDLRITRMNLNNVNTLLNMLNSDKKKFKNEITQLKLIKDGLINIIHDGKTLIKYIDLTEEENYLKSIRPSIEKTNNKRIIDKYNMLLNENENEFKKLLIGE